MTIVDDRRADPAVPDGGAVAIVCGGGSLPFAVADAAQRAGRRIVLFPLRGSADDPRLDGFTHHRIRYGQLGRFLRLTRAADCREMVLIGSVVRPTVAQLWPDYGLLALLPRMAGMFRGGDDHLLSRLAEMFQEKGLRVIGAHELAPDIMMPAGPIGRGSASARDRNDIARGLALLRATGPFDVGQAAVIADGRVLAIEAAEGTDAMLAHLADMRDRGRVHAPAGAGVLVKAPKAGQDRRLDLPSIGPQTVENAALAGLAGIAVVAGGAVVADPERIAEAADRAGLFVIGIDPAEFAG